MSSSTGDRVVVPIYYGEHYLIGDTVLRDQYERDKSAAEAENTRSCDEQRCSYWTGARNDRTAENDDDDGDDETTGASDEASAAAAAVVPNDDGGDDRQAGPLNIIAAAVPMNWSLTSQQQKKRDDDDDDDDDYYDDDDDDDDYDYYYCGDDDGGGCRSPGFEIVFESPSDESSSPERSRGRTKRAAVDDRKPGGNRGPDAPPKHKRKKK